MLGLKLLAPHDHIATLARRDSQKLEVFFRGIRVNGLRPVISGGTNTVEFRLSDHYLFEGFDVTGGSFRGIYHHAHDITIRDTVVHDCPAHGILGADNDFGEQRVIVQHQYVQVNEGGRAIVGGPFINGLGEGENAKNGTPHG